MDSGELYLKAYPIVDRAKGLSAEKREAFLDEACEGDSELRAAAAELMRRVETASDWNDASPLDTPYEEDLSGEEVAGFALEEPIGRGGMGVVYRARQESPRREVALKLLRSSWSSPERQRQFKLEAEVLANLTHPFIASLLEYGTWTREGGARLQYFAMELVQEAREFLAYCREQPLARRDRLELFAKVCDAVQHGHTRGIVHRDLKPSNVLVDGEGNPRVIDFGLAHVSQDSEWLASRFTLGDTVVGTLAYMAPEQYDREHGEVSERTDVYALGLLLFELLCDRPAVLLPGKSVVANLRELTRTRVPLPSEIASDVDEELDLIVRMATRREPSARYANAGGIARDIADHLAGRTPHIAGAPDASRGDVVLSRFRALSIASVGLCAMGLAFFLGHSSTSQSAYGGSEHEVSPGPDEAVRAEGPVSDVVDLASQSLARRQLDVGPGTTLITGGTYKLTEKQDWSLRVSGKAGATATLRVVDASLRSARLVTVGASQQARATIEVGPGGSWFHRPGDKRPTVTSIGDGGPGELQVFSGGEVFLDDIVAIGESETISGLLMGRVTVKGPGSSARAWYWRVGANGRGDLDVCDSATLVAQHSLCLGFGVRGDGRLWLSGAGTKLSFSDPRGTRDLVVGRRGAGLAHIADGAQLDLPNPSDSISEILVGDLAGSRGELSIVGGANFWTDGRVTVARSGGSSGRILVQGPSTRLHAGEVLVGMSNGGLSTPPWPEAVVHIQRSSLEVRGAIEIGARGECRIESGRVKAEEFLVSGGVLYLSGVVSAAVRNEGEILPESVRIEGEYAQSQAGRLILQVPAVGPQPELEVTGHATLSGRVHVVLEATLRSGETRTLLTAGGLSGRFDEATFEGPGSESVELQYTGKEVVLVSP